MSVVCADERERRAALLGHPGLNGIDFLEVDESDRRILRVTFLNPLPSDAYGLAGELERIHVTGGTRIVGVRVVSAARTASHLLEIAVDRVGDFSPYTLRLVADELDPLFASVEFSFRAGCPVDLTASGRPPAAPAAEAPDAPALDYLAKDYASFRRLLLDLLPTLNPRFVERNPADVGVALVELLSYAGDRLSYFQDAVANEAYLETARRRISLRRHARLVDYRVDDGSNAGVALQVRVKAGTAGPSSLPARTKAVTRVVSPLLGEARPPRAVVAERLVTAETLETDPALAGAAVFETTHAVECWEANNELFVHTWGNEECCVPLGTTEAWLYAAPDGTNVVRPVLQAGDLIVLEEARGPATGLPGDADLGRRQVVVLTEEPVEDTDELFASALDAGELRLREPADAPLPLLHVRWGRSDALRVPLCVSRRDPELGLLRNLSVARGNVVAADHGVTVLEGHVLPEPADGRFRLRLDRGPLTIRADAAPAVELHVLHQGASASELWRPVPDLLESPPFEQDFVAEIDDDGHAVLRFGDDENGRSVAGATSITAVYRIGNGSAGNVGAESIVHVALPPSVDGAWIDAVRNPIAASGGRDPETVAEIRERAPQAFRATTLRAVTAEDWTRAARDAPGVQSAVAGFRWTGSWYAVVIGIDPDSRDDLVTDPDGRIRLQPGFEARTRAFLDRYRIAGYDLELLPPTFVPLELELVVCAAPGFFRADVAEAVAEALSARDLAGGRRGFFHVENLTFAQPVRLSAIYAAVEAVEGVDSVEVQTFKRLGRAAAGELDSGLLPIEPGEIAQLDNDPNFLEHGVLRVVAAGGKA
jgi:hypothetical protein